jgi:PPOX class probable F420-dependent enzyme
MIGRVIDESTEFGARAARRLRDEIVVWMTTVTPGGGPVPRPVWFHWDGGDSVLMYSQPKTRIRNLEASPRVSLNFDGDGDGGDIVYLSGAAEIDDDAPPAHEHAEYLAKYDAHIARLGMTPEAFAESYSVPVRIRIARVGGH